jgi:hypothetical protein
MSAGFSRGRPSENKAIISPILEQELHDELERLPVGQQRQVLDFARALVAARMRGVPGHNLLHLAGAIEPHDLSAISQAVEEGCEKVSPHDW